jgi:hypothetical protein
MIMKFGQYLDQLKQLARKDKSILQLDVVYSTDDEGNGFSGIYYSPTIGVYDGDYEFDGFDPDDTESSKGKTANAVCIN